VEKALIKRADKGLFACLKSLTYEVMKLPLTSPMGNEDKIAELREKVKITNNL